MEQFHHNPSLLLNRTIGHYQIKELLGSGTFSHAYLAFHTYLEINVVLKILHQYMDARERDAFQVEARTIAQVRHPNIIRVLEFGEHERIPYYVMDYAQKGTLAEYVTERGGTLSIDDILTLLYPLGHALSYFHEETGMVHRDIKPHNILLDIDHTNTLIARLGDFGFTFPTSSQRADFVPDIAGTRQYMSPEQLAGKAQSKSDQYSLAVVVYELLTGHYPRNLRESKEMRSLASYGVPEHPQSLAIQSVLTKALSLRPQDRYRNEMVFMDALTVAKQTSPAMRRPAAPSEPVSEHIPEPESEPDSTTYHPAKLVPVMEHEISDQLRGSILASYGPDRVSKPAYVFMFLVLGVLGVLSGGTVLGLMNMNLMIMGITALLPLLGLLISFTLDFERRKLLVNVYANGFTYRNRKGEQYIILWEQISRLDHSSYDFNYTSDFGGGGVATHHDYTIFFTNQTFINIDEEIDRIGLLWDRLEVACRPYIQRQ